MLKITLQYILTLQQYFKTEQLPIFYFAKNNWGIEINSSLLPIDNPNEHIVPKAYPNSFLSTRFVCNTAGYLWHDESYVCRFNYSLFMRSWLLTHINS